MALRVLVVQHAEKERTGGDPGLTPVGRAQAERTAAHLAVTAGAERERPAAVLSSPLRRAVETAEPIGRLLGLPVDVDDRLRERMNWSGAGSVDAFLQDWGRATADRSYRPADGDSSLDAAARFLAALDDLRAAHPDGTAVVVSHGGVTADALRTLLGDDEVRRLAPSVIDDGVPPCALTTLHGGAADGGWTVEAIASTAHLD